MDNYRHIFKINRSLLIMAALLFAFMGVNAQTINVPFTPRTSPQAPAPHTGKANYNLKGDFTQLGNTNSELVNYGDNTNNGTGNPVQFVDIDGDFNTVNSSRSELVIPDECSNIVYAGLYWSARPMQTNDEFNVTTSVSDSGGIPVNESGLQINYNENFSYSSYKLNGVNRYYDGFWNPTDYRLVYTLTGNGDTYHIRLNDDGPNWFQYKINGSASDNSNWINVPVTFTDSGNFRTYTLDNPLTFNDGNLAITVTGLRKRHPSSSSSNTNQNAAVIYYDIGGSTNPTSQQVTRTLNKKKVKLKKSGQGYVTINALNNEIAYPGSATNNGDYIYAAYADVTDYVRQHGAGDYFVADIAAEEGVGGGTGFVAGWSMVVVYEDSSPGAKWRNITVFDGYGFMSAGVGSSYLNVSGFQAVQSGDVNVTLGIMASEGDVGIPGDYFQIRTANGTNGVPSNYRYLNHNGDTSTNQSGAYNNFFNSSIQIPGSRFPNHNNNSGIDIHRFDLNNTNKTLIANNQTSTSFRYGSSQDVYAIYCIVFAVDAYIPDVSAENNADGGVGGIPAEVNGNPLPNGGMVDPGDELEFDLKIFNRGNEPMKDTQVKVFIPPTTTFTGYNIVGGHDVTSTNSTVSWLDHNGNPGPIPASAPGGTLVWDIGNLSRHTNTDDVLGQLKYTLEVTDDCLLLASGTDSSCALTMHLNGVISGKGATSNLIFPETPLITKYNTLDTCEGPQYDPFDFTIVVSDEFLSGCGFADGAVFETCDDAYPRSEVENHFPAGSKFYSEIPDGTDTYIVTGDFPGSLTGTDYYVLLPGINSNCYHTFTVISDPLPCSVPQVQNVKVCPDETVNLDADVLTNNPPLGYTVEWWTTPDRQAGTQVTNPAQAGPGTYYAFFKSPGGDYSGASLSAEVSYYAPGEDGGACGFTAEIALDKEAIEYPTGQDVAPNALIKYQFKVTNPGNTPLENIQVTDPLIGLSTIQYISGDTNSDSKLDPGEEWIYEATYPITQDDINAGTVHNVATATGDAWDGPRTATDDEDVPLAQDPSIELEKTGVYVDANGDGQTNAGDEIHYSFTVTNTGNVKLTNITLSDILPNIVLNGGPITSLDPGAFDFTTFTGIYTITQDDINDGKVDNTATATGQDPKGNDVADDDSFSVPLSQRPAYTIVKTATSSGPYEVGDVITYEIVVTNTGNVDLSNVTVTDSNADAGSLQPNGGVIGALDVGQSVTLTAERTVTQDDMNAGESVNVAVVNGDDPKGNPVPPKEDDEKTPHEQSPAIHIVKEAVDPDGDYILGSVIDYEITVTNTGNVDLVNVVVTDNNADAGSLQPNGGVIGALGVGESVTLTAQHTVTGDDITAGIVINTAVVTGKTEGGTSVTDNDSVTVPVTGHPFECDTNIYMVAGNNDSQLYIVDTSVPGDFTYIPLGPVYPEPYNALGYNTMDNYLYGMINLTPGKNNHLLRIDSNGIVADLGAVTGLPEDNWNSGVFDDLGNYYVRSSGNSGKLYKIDVAAKTAVQLNFPVGINDYDFAWNPQDGLLYGVSIMGQLFSFDPVVQGTAGLTLIGDPQGTGVFGGMFATKDGHLYGVQHKKRYQTPVGFYEFNMTDGTRVKLSNAPMSDNGDMAYCHDAEPPFTVSTDLAVTKKADRTEYIVGETITYTIVATNNGPYPLTHPSHVYDEVPAGIPAANMTYTAVASAGASTQVVGTQSGAIDDYVVLEVGASVTYTVELVIPNDYSEDTLTNTVSITAPEGHPDTDLSNNEDSVTVDIVPGDPFECDTNIYMVAGNNDSQLYIVDTSIPGNFTYIPLGPVYPEPYNALGYNTMDNYLYGMINKTPGRNNHLLRIDSNGNVADLGVVAGLPEANWNSGVFDDSGNYYVRSSGNSGKLYKIDVAAKTAVQLNFPVGINDYDFAWNPQDGLLYGVSIMGQLFSFDPVVQGSAGLTLIGDPQGTGIFGGLFATKDGHLYGVQHKKRYQTPVGFYEFNMTDGTRVKLSDAPATDNGDMAYCHDAEPPFTISTDLAVTKEADRAEYLVGETITYTIVATNNGPYPLTHPAHVFDEVPAGIPAANMTYTAVASAGASTQVVGTQSGAINDYVVLEVGASVTYTVELVIPNDYSEDTLTNTVSITPPDGHPDTDLSNNEDSATVNVVPGDPFECDTNIYMVAGNNDSQLYIVDTSVPGDFTYIPLGPVYPEPYNALGYNTADNYLYGMINKTPGRNNHLLRIDSNGIVTDLGAVAGLPEANWNSGVFDDSGNYYVRSSGNSGKLYKIDVDAMTAVQLNFPVGINDYDFAYNPQDGLLYGVSIMGQLFSFDPVVQGSAGLTLIGDPQGTGVFGGMFATKDGHLYGIQHKKRYQAPVGFYEFNMTDGTRVKLSDAPATDNGDMAYCHNAEPPFTIPTDLAITKEADAAEYTAGDTITYTIVATNNGPYPMIHQSNVYDAVPAGIPAANMSYTAVASTGAATQVAGTRFGAIDDYVTLLVGASVTYTVKLIIPADYSEETLTNTASIMPPDGHPDLDMSNNEASVTVEINKQALFDCDDTIYMVAGDYDGQLYIVDTSNPAAYDYVPLGPVYPEPYNALGYNTADNYLYGMINKTPGRNNHLLRIDSNGIVIDLGAVAGLPEANWNSGVFDDLGNYYVRSNGNSGKMYMIDIANMSAVQLNFPSGINDYDLAWNPQNGLLYGVSVRGQLFSFDPSIGGIAGLNLIGTAQGTGVFGGLFIDADENMYGIQHRQGYQTPVGFYKFDISNGTRVKLSEAPASINGDVAFCSLSSFDPLSCDISLIAEVDFDRVCIDEDEYYDVIVSLTGTSNYDEFMLTDDQGNSKLMTVEDDAVFSYLAGVSPNYYVYAVGDEEGCSAEANAESPEICEDTPSEDPCSWIVRVWATGNGAGASWSIMTADGEILESESNTPASFSHIRSFIAAGPLTFNLNATGIGYTSVNYAIYNVQGKISSGTIRDRNITVTDLTCSVMDARMNGDSTIQDFQFSYHPNPAKDVLNIDSTEDLERVQVFTLAGIQTMEFDKGLSTSNQLDITKLDPGMYFFRAVFADGRIETFKVIKK